MKKFFLTTAAILVLLLVCFGWYVQYRKWSSYQTLIHKEAAALIRVNVYGIIQSLIPDYLSSSSGKGKAGKTKEKVRGTGLELPANVFIYAVRSKAPTTLFTSLEVNDVADFEYTLNRLFNEHTTGKTNPAYTTFTTSDNKLSICYSSKLAAIAYSMNGEDVHEILGDIILQKNVVKVSESNFKRVKSLEGHILYQDANNMGSLSFHKGKVTAELRMKTDRMIVPVAGNLPNMNAQAPIVLGLNAMVSKAFAGKVFMGNGNNLEADSILKYYHNSLLLELNGTVLQQEQVVTYAYNDDFEKEEKTKTREVAVPDIALIVRSSPQLYDYLVREKVIDQDSNTISRAVFPLYRLYVLKTANGLQISTGTVQKAPAVSTNQHHFGELHINFDELEKQQQFPALIRYIHSLKSLSIAAKKEDESHLEIKATLKLDNASKNALLQLADNL